MGLSPAHGLNSRLPPKNHFQSMRSKPTREPVHATCNKSKQPRVCHTSNFGKSMCKERLAKAQKDLP